MLAHTLRFVFQVLSAPDPVAMYWFQAVASQPVNIRFVFNGDRLAFVKGYKLRKDDHPTLPGLNLEQRAALPAPDKTTS